jgi:hypothetical protein
VLCSRFSDVAELLRSTGFNHARSVLEDDMMYPRYRQSQLQNIQSSVNKAIQLLESSPAVQYGNWVAILGRHDSLGANSIRSIVLRSTLGPFSKATLKMPLSCWRHGHYVLRWPYITEVASAGKWLEKASSLFNLHNESDLIVLSSQQEKTRRFAVSGILTCYAEGLFRRDLL